ncbi:MAG TPA: NADH-quinone oxidoreductase subunit L, partial [Anaeromyxobacteraceae bacterium]|nr:NADH-quinone oxidoreductase subunit L [Anaeromyxobacteraceae bacterium]
ERFMGRVFSPATAVLERTGHLHGGDHPSWPYFFAWAVAVLGTAIGWLAYAGAWRTVPGRLAAAFPAAYRFAYDKFRVDELYEKLVLGPFRSLSYLLWRVVDVFAIDGLLVNGVARVIGFFGSVIRLAQNGDVQRYAAVMAVAAAVILWAVIGGGSP